MRKDIIEASKLHFKSHIEKHRINVENLLEKGVGVAEHPDIMETIEKELDIIKTENEIKDFEIKTLKEKIDMLQKQKKILQNSIRKYG